MKVKTGSILAAAVAMAFMAVDVPAVFAQRSNGTFSQAPQTRPATPPQGTRMPIPSTVILPMSNPVAPMGNPVAPIISSPYVRYGGTSPTVVVPEPARGNRGNNGRGRDGRDVVYVPVAVPTYYYPPSYNYYPEYEPTPATVPGQLPGVRYDYSQRQGAFNSTPNTQAPAPPASTVVYIPQSEVYSEPIVNEPRPNRVIQPPAIGTSRADVVASLGQPWGTVSARGQETLYFDGLTVVLADGRVIQVR
jgi:hypothetical protein